MANFRQIEARDGPLEEPRGDSDLMEFYNLLRLYNHLTNSAQIDNFHKQLNGTMFSCYHWHGGEENGLAPLASLTPSDDAVFKIPLNHTFKPQPGEVELTEAEKGPILDILALGDPVVLQSETRKRQRDSPEKESEGKAKKAKKDKKSKKEKTEKKKRSSEMPSQEGSNR